MPVKLRVEISIPLTYNNGKNIEMKKLLNLKDELVDKFKAISTDDTIVDGTWINPTDGKAYYDKCKRWIVDIDISQENAIWLRDYKEKLKKELNQIEIYITIYKIQTL